MKEYTLYIRTYDNEESFKFDNFNEMKEFAKDYENIAIEIIMTDSEGDELLADGRAKSAVELADYMWAIAGTWD